ncbi:MAG: hypothetical protein EA383_10170 [Spirochaetaceae bacterium]|nr:MAG: hypothetical protein EA383_10170 [Spirochaetaceae bacterium]
MEHQDDFAEAFGGFLFDYADEVTYEFDQADRIPLNLSLQYFETVVFLFARTGSILPYFSVDDEIVEAMKASVKGRLLSEFGTVHPDRLSEAFESRLSEYESVSDISAPFSEGWYSALFCLYRDAMIEAGQTGKVFIWNIGREVEADSSTNPDLVLEIVHRAEIRHIVPFQRLVINFFNFQTE